ncbi:MAG TPA: hypothetical protein VMT59_13055 [Gaiellaceae bacterium]|nr:hypothetical protein [Gaiellaceae bacterium]
MSSPHPDEPGVHHRRRNYAAAIYGLILADSVLAVYREEASSVGASTVAVTVLGTSLVFWLAHVYAELLAFRIDHRRSPAWPDALAAMRYEWPIVQASGLPVLALLLGVFDIISDKKAVTLALLVCFAELGGLGLESARSGGASGLVAWVSGLIALLLGAVVVGLKVVVQH